MDHVQNKKEKNEESEEVSNNIKRKRYIDEKKRELVEVCDIRPLVDIDELREFVDINTNKDKVLKKMRLKI